VSGVRPPTIPERPRLGWGVRAFDSDGTLVLRQPTRSLALQPDARGFVTALLALLDGRTSTEVCRGMGEAAVAAVQVLGHLASQGLLVEHEERTRPLPVPAALAPPRLESVRVVVSGDAALTGLLEPALAALGAHVRRGELADARDAIAVVCRTGPDLAALEALNTVARREEIPWVPIVTMIDECLVGPLIHASSPCFSCLELRWLGISQSVELERRFFEHLRRGAWEEEARASVATPEWVLGATLPALARRLATKDGERVLTTSFADAVQTERPLVRHALCDVCGQSRGMSSTPAAWTDSPVPLSVLGPALERFADDRFGIGPVEPTPPEKQPSEPGLPHIALSRFAFPRPAEVRGKQTNWSHGAAGTPEDARTLATVEALERYSGLMPPLEGLVAAYEAVSDEALFPPELPLYSPAQYRRPGFPCEPFQAARPLRWLAGTSLTHGCARLVPAAVVHYGEDDWLVSETSSGVAAHSARSAALLNGLSELVERDAFMIHWLNRLSPPLVDIDASRDDAVGRFLRVVRSAGWEPKIAETTTDLGIPAFLALGIRDDGKGHALLVGGGASLDAGTALRRALGELYSAVVSQPAEWTPPAPLAPEDVTRAQQHADVYAFPENLARAAFLWASSRRSAPPLPAEPAAERLADAVERFRARGFEVVGVDMTAPDIAGHGLHVVRAIVPGLVPFGFGRTALRLGGRRLYEAPVRMGFQDLPSREEDLNPDPHVYP
jgi:ribosomal protein S12 methylthiotransferase accessory factor